MLNLKNYNIISFDLETSGFSYRYNSIIQISAISENGRIFNETCNPYCKINSKISALTGLSNELLSLSDNIQSVLSRFLKFLKGFGNPCLVGTNIFSFDLSFLFKACVDFDLEFPVVRCIDMLQIFRKYLPKPHKLSEVYKFIVGSELQGAHNALVDCTAVLEIMKHAKFNNYVIGDIKHVSSNTLFNKWKIRWKELQHKHNKNIRFLCKNDCFQHSKYFNGCTRYEFY